MTRAHVHLAGLLIGFAAAQIHAQVGAQAPAPAGAAAPGSSPVTSQAPEAAPRRVALVMGHAAYVEAPRLANAARDGRDVCAALQRLGFEADCHTDLADRDAMLAVLKAFTARLGSQTQAVLYYAGHAVQLQGENFLLPVQVRLRGSADVAAQSVRLDEILALLRASGSAFNFVVLDACRDDPFEAAAAAPSGTPAAGASTSNTSNTSNTSTTSTTSTTVGATRGARGAAGPGMPARDKATRGERLGAASFGLGVIRDAPTGSIVLYATGAGEPAFDGRGRNGPLTKHFLAHLDAPGLPIEEFLKRVTAGVQADTQSSLGRRQTPFVYSSFTGNFCFAGCRPVPLESEVEDLRRATRELEQDLQRSRERSTPRPAPRIPPAL